jgi:transcription elongation factor Elf1
LESYYLNQKLFSLYRCPECGSEKLALTNAVGDVRDGKEDVVTADITCVGCGRVFEVKDRSARLLTDEFVEAKKNE